MTSSKIEQRAGAVAGRAQPGEEPGRRRDQAHVGRDRLDHHAGDVVADSRHDVVRRHDGLADRGLGHPGRARQAEGGHAAAPGGQQRVAVAVVVAGELDDLRPPGDPAGQPQRGHGGLGAAVDQADLLAARHPLARSPRPASSPAPSGAPYDVPAAAAAVIGLDHLRMGVAEDDGAVALHQVDVARRPSTSHTYGPSARATKYGVPPTDRNARTGELTPPGMTRWDRSNSSSFEASPRPRRSRARNRPRGTAADRRTGSARAQPSDSASSRAR